jgi:hypothetical protein
MTTWADAIYTFDALSLTLQSIGFFEHPTSIFHFCKWPSYCCCCLRARGCKEETETSSHASPLGSCSAEFSDSDDIFADGAWQRAARCGLGASGSAAEGQGQAAGLEIAMRSLSSEDAVLAGRQSHHSLRGSRDTPQPQQLQQPQPAAAALSRSHPLCRDGRGRSASALADSAGVTELQEPLLPR